MSGRIPPVHHSGCHHAAICTRDWDASMRFWTDGMGLVQMFEGTMPGPWAALFAASGDALRSVFLHDPIVDDAGLDRLAAIGMGGAPRRVELPAPDGPVAMAVVRDPNGVLVELIGMPQ